MKKIILSAFTSVLLILFFGCRNEKNEDLKIITERIQYDVTIKAPEADLDWWVMNIDGSRREWLIDLILQTAYDGQVQAFNYDVPITSEEVQAIGYRNDTLIMPSMEPPYEDSVVVINERLKRQDIHRLRFLEEWRINEKTLEIEKKVLGIALVLSDYEKTTGELRGYRPIFWVYFDENYPEVLN
ncbi:MAG: hypothetical protein PHT69_09785 [Bacteroidales bacterium]|nr:hypothetical protein [Bacteroidales bacterium]